MFIVCVFDKIIAMEATQPNTRLKQGISNGKVLSSGQKLPA